MNLVLIEYYTFQNFNKISEFFASYFCIYDMYFK